MNLKKSSDINKNVVDDELTHKGLKNNLIKKLYKMHKMKRIQSKDHITGLYRINKISLFPYDDKHTDGYSRLSHSHQSFR